MEDRRELLVADSLSTAGVEQSLWAPMFVVVESSSVSWSMGLWITSGHPATIMATVELPEKYPEWRMTETTRQDLGSRAYVLDTWA